MLSAVISVIDNSRGIAKEDLGRIFTNCERISLNVEGSGVGLYLISEIIKLAGGINTVESEPGRLNFQGVY